MAYRVAIDYMVKNIPDNSPFFDNTLYLYEIRRGTPYNFSAKNQRENLY